MTYRTIADRLLRYIGIQSLATAANANALNQRGLEDQDIPDVVTCLQGSLEEIFTLMPSGLVEREVGGVLRPGASVTVSVTNYSAACTLSGYATWMLGCTIRIPGDDLDNRLISSTQLLRPFMGSTGSVGATVYGDCIPVAATYCQVIEPVKIPCRPKLQMMGSREEFNIYTDFPRHGVYGLANKSIGEPRAWLADFESLGSAQASLYLRVNPMPGLVYALTFVGRIAPPTITAANIYNSGTPDTDPGVSSFLPNASSTLLAFALQRWTAHPSFSADSQQLQEIARQYKVAKELIEKRTAQVGRQRAIYANG